MSCRRSARGAAVLVLVALMASSAFAGHGGFGDVLDVASPEVVLSLKSASSTAICFVDSDGNGGYGLGDPVVLSINNGCSGNSDSGDVRLARWGSNMAGQRLGVASDVNRPLSTPPGSISFWYYDANGNGRMDDGDTVYANLKAPQNGFVDVADVRLSAYGEAPAGEQVSSSSPDVGLTLALLGSPAVAVGYVDTNNNNAFDHTDLPFLNSDMGGAETVEFGDLRLMAVSAERPFGTFVAPGDSDGDMLLTSVSRSLCFADTDASGGYNGGDPLFFDLDSNCVGNVALGDVRLSATGDGDAGSRVMVGDRDEGLGLSALGGSEVAFVDNDGDARFTMGDVMVLDIVAPATRRADVGDVRISPSEGAGGLPVAGDTALEGAALRSLGLFQTRVAFIPYGGGSTPGPNDPLYINADGGSDEGVEPNDVRLARVGDLPFGANARLSDGDVLARLVTASATVCFTSSSSSSTYRSGDGLYLALTGGCGGGVRSGMMRLVTIAGHAPGTAVKTTDSDHSGTTQTVPGVQAWKYYDIDGDGEWGLEDRLYLDIVGETSQRVDVGDVRISHGSLPGGQAVSAGDGDVSLPLQTLGSVSSRVGFVDGNGDGVFDAADFAYVDARGDGGFVTILDVRLTPLPAPAMDPVPDPVPDPDGDNETTPPPPDGPGDDGTNGQDDDGGLPGDGNGTGGNGDDNETEPDGPRGRTPGPGFALVGLVVVGILSLLRRRI